MTPDQYLSRLRKKYYGINHAFGTVQRDLGDSDIVEIKQKYKKRANGGRASQKKQKEKREQLRKDL